MSNDGADLTVALSSDVAVEAVDYGAEVVSYQAAHAGEPLVLGEEGDRALQALVSATVGTDKADAGGMGHLSSQNRALCNALGLLLAAWS